MAGIRVLHSNCRLNIQDRGYQARPLRVINMRIAKTLGLDVLLQLQQRAENDALTKFLLHLRTTGYVLLAHHDVLDCGRRPKQLMRRRGFNKVLGNAAAA
jgi:hypothetical protein